MNQRDKPAKTPAFDPRRYRVMVDLVTPEKGSAALQELAFRLLKAPSGSERVYKSAVTTEVPRKLAALFLRHAGGDTGWLDSDQLYEALRPGKCTAAWLTERLGDPELELTARGERKHYHHLFETRKPRWEDKVKKVRLTSAWDGLQVELRVNGIPQARELFPAAAAYLLQPGAAPVPTWRTHAPAAQPVETPLPPLPRPCIPRPRFREAVETFLARHKAGFLEVTGAMGHGKTTAVMWLLHEWRRERRPFAVHFVAGQGHVGRDPRHIALALYDQLVARHALQPPADWETRFPQLDPNSARLRLDALLSLLSPDLVRAGKREVLCIEAADQVDAVEAGALIPRIIGSLPPGVFGLITTRPHKEGWKGPGSRTCIVESLEFTGLADDRAATRLLLSRRNARLRPRLPAAFLKRIFADPDRVPVMFTVDRLLRVLELADPADAARCRQLRDDPAAWLAAPADLVADEVEAVIQRAGRLARPLGREEVLTALGLLAAAAEPLRPSWIEAMDLEASCPAGLFRLAANFFHRRPDLEPDAPWQFSHPGYGRELLARVREAGLHLRLGRACVAAAGRPEDPAHGYALRHGVRHLLEAGRRDEAVRLLRETPFLDACAAAFPREPERVLAPLAACLAAAVAAPDVAAAAWLTLEHARRVERLRRVTPIQAWLSTQDWRYAWQIAERDAEPDRGRCYQLWLIRELRRAGRTAEAEAAQGRLAGGREVGGQSMFQDLYNCLAGSYLPNEEREVPRLKKGRALTPGEFDRWLTTAPRIVDYDDRIDALIALFHDFPAGQDARAARRLNDALATARQIGNGYVLGALFPVLAAAQDARAAQRLDDALAAVRQIHNVYDHAIALAALATALIAAQDSRAAQVLDGALATVRVIKDDYRCDHALAALFPALAAAQDTRAAQRLDDALATARQIRDDYRCDRAFVALFHALAAAQHPRVAQVLDDAPQIEFGYHRVCALVALHPILAAAQHPRAAQILDDALDDVRQIGHGSDRVHALVALFHALAATQDSRAAQVLDDALDGIRQGYWGDYQRALACAALFPVLAATQDARAAHVLEDARKIWHGSDDARALVALFPVLATAHDARIAQVLDDALNAARQVRGDHARSRSLTALFPVLAAAQDDQAEPRLREAEHVFRASRPDSEALSEAANLLASEGLPGGICILLPLLDLHAQHLPAARAALLALAKLAPEHAPAIAGWLYDARDEPPW